MGTGVGDVKRRVAFRAFGAVRILCQIQGALEDVEGAIERGQPGVAAYQARTVVLVCLSIRSLAVAGEIDDDETSLSFDFFAGVPASDIAEALTLANDALDLDAATSAAWLDRLRDYVAATERLLDYDEPLPILRSPEGSFGLIGIARRWTATLEACGLPPLMLSAGSVGAPPREPEAADRS